MRGELFGDKIEVIVSDPGNAAKELLCDCAGQPNSPGNRGEIRDIMAETQDNDEFVVAQGYVPSLPVSKKPTSPTTTAGSWG